MKVRTEIEREGGNWEQRIEIKDKAKSEGGRWLAKEVRRNGGESNRNRSDEMKWNEKK